MSNIYNDIDSTLLSQEEIEKKVTELAQIINTEYSDKNPIMVCILKGSAIFYSDLCKQITCKMQMDFMQASSYGNGTETTGMVIIKKELDNDIKGRHVVLIEDIIDSGVTLSNLKIELQKREPASLKIMTLLSKRARRESDIEADYCGFEIDDYFVVGYGLDFAEQYRNMPYVGVLKKEVYEQHLKAMKA